jgi:hypothetical protein
MKKFIFAIACLLTSMAGFAQDALTIKDATITAGTAGELEVILTNPETKYVNCQFDITLPEGLTVATNAAGTLGKSSYKLTPRTSDEATEVDFTIGLNQIEAGHYRVTIYEANNAAFFGNSGDPILILKVNAAEDFKGGEVKLTDIVLTNEALETYKPEAATSTVTEPNTAPVVVNNDALTINDITLNAGEAGQLEVILTNPATKYVNCQFDITMPAGLTLATNAAGNLGKSSYKLTPRTSDAATEVDFTIGLNEIEAGHYRVTIYEANNTAFFGNSGDPILILNVIAANDCKGGEVKLSDIVLTNEALETYKPADATCTVTVNAAETPVEGAFIAAKDITIEKGKTAELAFTINAETPAAIAEFKLSLPTGISILFDEEEDDYVYELGKDMTVKTHSATIKKQDTGAFYVLVSNSSGKEFKAATGTYLTVTLTADDNAESGDGVMREIILGDINAKQMNTMTEFKFAITVDGTPTGIDNIEADNSDAAAFNMAGQKVNKGYKGIIIKNGKKMMVK